MNFHPARVPMGKVLSPLLLILIIIPAYQGSQISNPLQHFDLVVGNGNSLTFIKDLSNESSNVSIVVTDLERDKRATIVSVVPDLQNNAVYFSVVTRDSSFISVYYLQTQKTVQIHTGSRRSIESVALYKNHLYWCNESNKTVMRLQITNWADDVDNSSKGEPELVFSDANATFESFTIHPTTGVIYYTKWASSGNSQIRTYDPITKNVTIFVEKIYQPKGLYIDGNEYLYWIDNPPGVYFHLERVGLEENHKREIIFRGQNQHPFSIAVVCNKMYWSNVMNKGLWELNINDKSKSMIEYFKDGTPYGLALTKVPSKELCKNDTQEIQKSVPTLIKTTEKPAENLIKKDQAEDPLKSTLPKGEINNPQKSASNSEISKSPEAYQDAQKDEVDAHFCSEDNHCQNGASCVVIKNQSVCICASGFGGTTCSEKTGINNFFPSLSSWSSNPPFFASCIVFTFVIVALLMIILRLALKLRKLDVKPRIRRRVVVAHRSDFENPATGGSSSVCEMIDIENCCNMNVCETPCYERLGSISAGSSNGRTRKNSVKEDKKCLLSSS